jgi:hypothetical protein
MHFLVKDSVRQSEMQGSEKDLWWFVMRNPKLIGEMIAGCN